jgi:hypothetical protein
MVTFNCKVEFFVLAVSPTATFASAALAVLPGSSRLLGDSLSAHYKSVSLPLPTPTILIHAVTEERTKTVFLRPGQKYELFNVNPSVSGFTTIRLLIPQHQLVTNIG